MKKKVFLKNFHISDLKKSNYLKWLENLNNIKNIGRQELFLIIKKKNIKKYVTDIINNDNIFFYLILNEKKTPIGTVKLHQIDWYSRNADIGIMIDQEFWSKGYATLAIKSICNFAFKKLGLHKVTAGFMRTNSAIQKAFLKNKFKIEGIKKNHLYAFSKYHDMVIVGLINSQNK